MAKPLTRSKLKKLGTSSVSHLASKPVVAKQSHLSKGNNPGLRVFVARKPKPPGKELHVPVADFPGRIGAGRTMTISNLIQSIKAGLPVRELDSLRMHLDLPMETLVPMIGISKATLHRRKATGRLDMAESDRVVRFARLLERAAEVMESIEEGRRWLTSAQVGLGGAIPLEYAQTEVGAREVENLLGRIEYGVYS